MSHLMADGKRVCGKPGGHKGKHYSEATVQREAERMLRRRTTPGPCTMKGCTRPREQFDTGSYDVRCYVHRDRHKSEEKLAKAKKARDLAYQEKEWDV